MVKDWTKDSLTKFSEHRNGPEKIRCQINQINKSNKEEFHPYYDRHNGQRVLIKCILLYYTPSENIR